MPMSKRFKSIWNEVNKGRLSYLPVQCLHIQANDFKQSTIAFLQRRDIGQEQVVRDDYKELFELKLIVFW